ncbi:DEAD/DEAH box helicase [Pelagovum pacificum]|uniref:Restriction endonuclease subunit R n=1 Tax=Pelagovum pacificum TaxID=2588711 RepID=A0A5C5GCI6_9RHOB|nr:DEAD/DEAH box helicase family protein [Pelagovum pacificum]QQA44508.1 DEAD/DEAH box helicase family protein [Pelagovum pacificum]TNY32378.1 restriction endonuclease subunit R [Pelagovum pacificum]
MAATNFELKEYQQTTLNRLRSFLRDASAIGPDGANLAFYKATNMPYRHAPVIADGTPYICLRIPTGGGKTVMGAYAVGIAAQEFMEVKNPMVLWLVPSTPILEQTVAALKDPDHPYRAALAKDFGRNVSVLTKGEALAMSRADAVGGACVIVSTIQSFRREKDNGKPNEEGLKVYQDAGSLMDHFSGLTEAQEARLEQVEGAGRPVASLANLLRLHRPMVIVDEAHNARTALSFDTLARFSPSLILELTATPQTEHKPPRDKHASNILYSVSAAELKAEEMIKMPIKLTTDSNWQKTIGAAYDCREALEEAAKAEQAETGEYIRPIILFQAQSASATDATRITYDKVEQHLKDRGIPEAEIAVHTGPRKDLDAYEIADHDCRIRYIITVSKLKEGWDCPFAYVLCSVAEQVSATAIEQVLGRVLRMPKAQRKRRDALNQAYAFVASKSFDSTAQMLKDGLVEGAGFNKMEADQIVSPQGDMGFADAADDFEHESDPLVEDETPAQEVEEAIAKLPTSVRNRVAYDPEKRSMTYKGPMTRESKNLLQLALAKSPKASRAIDRLYAKTNNFQLAASQDDEKPPFIVPMLGFRKQGELQLFSKEHFLDLPWRLDECDPSDITTRFKIVDESQSGEIDVSDKGKVEIDFAKRVQGELAAVVQEPAWTLPRLANFIDSGIRHPDITKPSAILFIIKAIEALIASGHDFHVLARNKHDLRRAISQFIADLRGERETGNYSALFATNAEDFATHSDLSMIFDEQSYAFNQPYAGARKFNKHYTPLIGDLKPTGEEFDCAAYLDSMDEVRFWIRNVEGKKTSFWLQLPHQKFYPDFMAMLVDGRILAVEYKGGHLYEGEGDKRRIGAVWADASGGKCLFCMPTERKFDLIDQTIL